MSKTYFGIDLGTSNSSISYITDSPRTSHVIYIDPATIKFNPPPNSTMLRNWERLSSAVYIEQKQKSRKVIAGFLAEEAALDKRAKPFENLFLSVKSDMGTLRIYEDSIDPEIITPVEVSSEIIKELIKAAEKETGISPKKSNVVITVPASFLHNQREDTIQAAKLAGLKISDGDLLDEPVAAFIYTACHQKLDAQLDMKEDKNILMFDLGAGTCDISIFQAAYDSALFLSGIGLSIRNKAISNYEKLGGDNIDLHIVEEEMLPVFCDKNGIDFNSISEKIKREIRYKLKMQAKKLKEEICRQITHHGMKKSIKQSWAIDAFTISELDIKTKKTSASISLDRFSDLMEPFVSDDIEKSYKISDDYVTFSFLGPVVSALKKADLYPEDIDAFIFNGGSCHNPILQNAFKSFEGFSNAKFFNTPDLDLSVSKGAGIHCYYLHKHKKPIVTPIVNNEIGIYTLGLKREKLIDAGSELPLPSENGFLMNDNFCVPEDNLDHVGISIYSGKSQVISNLKLSLPDGIRKGEPVNVGLRIDSNKVMHFTASLKNHSRVKLNFELSHPWTHNIHSPEDMAADELWREVAELKKRQFPVDPDMMVELANRERRRENLSCAVEILQRLQDKKIDSGNLNNILALCYEDMGRRENALNHFKKAAELSPDEVIFIANYGSQLVECGRVQEGISKLRQAVDIDPDSYFPYYWLGHAFRKLGDEEQATKEYTRARYLLRMLCSKYPDSERYLGFLKEVNMSLGDYEEADNIKTQLLKIRNSKFLHGSPDKLLAGPESGIWKDYDLSDEKI